MAKGKVQSVEPKVAHLVNGWLSSYNLEFKLEQEKLNESIANALKEYPSKSGGEGGNRPDAQILLFAQDGTPYPIMIEYKGYKDQLVKINHQSGLVENTDDKGEMLFKNINNYAVNGAVHYANAIIAKTDYKEVIAIGVTGYVDAYGELQTEIGVYYVSGKNLGFGQEISGYKDLSFLRKENFNKFLHDVKLLSLTQSELEKARKQREMGISAALMQLNNDIYNENYGLSEANRMHLIMSSILATYPTAGLPVIETKDLKSVNAKGMYDGNVILNRISAFVDKRNLPDEKKKYVLNTLGNILTTENLNIPHDGESTLKQIFSKVVSELGIYYKGDISTDFTGKLFNEMFNWLGFTQDKLNDVVLTPPYVAQLLVRLAKVNMDSYVWDFATGSAGLLVAAMNEMIDDAHSKIASPDELRSKIAHIKAEQLLGLEILPDVYMLAILNMILMGDGSSKILNKDSLKDYNGDYGYGKTEKYPATAFILNPPYSAEGNGMIFVAKALSMMKNGYAAIIIQGSAGSGKAVDFNKRILESNTLMASIKMPVDLFSGKSSVQTYIYVFRIGEPHDERAIVKFIDFSNDGYERTNRKKARQNLFDVDQAEARYREVVSVVHYGKAYVNLIGQENYYEGTIDPTSGKDWNQSAPRDTRPTLEDFKKTVSDYLAWEVSNILKSQKSSEDGLGK